MTNRTHAEIVEYLKTSIDEISLGRVAAADVGGDDHLIDDLGLDSLDYATVLLGAESWLGVKVSERDVDWSEIGKIGRLAEFLASFQAA